MRRCQVAHDLSKPDEEVQDDHSVRNLRQKYKQVVAVDILQQDVQEVEDSAQNQDKCLEGPLTVQFAGASCA